MVVFKRTSALRDLVEHYMYLAENADDAVADRLHANQEWWCALGVEPAPPSG